MCRLLAIPPGFKRKKAIEILERMEGHNTDGTGYAYVKNREFFIRKFPIPFTDVLEYDGEFLSHLPYNGWTICHLRAASQGENTFENTHPFETKNYCVAHNGIFEDKAARLLLKRMMKIKGETDSEVAAHIIDIAGPRRFSKAITFGGVFLALHRNGSLWVIKTSGELVMKPSKKEKVLIASELSFRKYPKQIEALNGCYHFDKHGAYASHEFTDDFDDFDEEDDFFKTNKPAIQTDTRVNTGVPRTVYHYGTNWSTEDGESKVRQLPLSRLPVDGD